jgi:hypothetical protein
MLVSFSTGMIGLYQVAFSRDGIIPQFLTQIRDHIGKIQKGGKCAIIKRSNEEVMILS